MFSQPIPQTGDAKVQNAIRKYLAEESKPSLSTAMLPASAGFIGGLIVGSEVYFNHIAKFIMRNVSGRVANILVKISPFAWYSNIKIKGY
jgi:hypothetical protein